MGKVDRQLDNLTHDDCFIKRDENESGNREGNGWKGYLTGYI